VVTLPDITPSAEDNFHFERQLFSKGYTCVVGVDEVGRGPLAGPVVASCVSLPKHCDPTPFLDSKKTTHKQRLHLANILLENKAPIGIGIVSHKKIDAINILQASLLAMKLAVMHHAAVANSPDFLLVDGKFEIPIEVAQLPLIKGESKSGSIAAASIMAKLQRDNIMVRLHEKFPHYNFRQNKGYPTKAHRTAIAEFGPCSVHRMTFKGVKEFVFQT
jgi:ribonuclease HII